MPMNKFGKGRFGSSFRFGFSRSLMIYLMLSVLIVAGNCSAAQAKKDPPNWDKTLEKGNHLLAIGDSQEAANFFSEKLRKNPDCAPCHLGLGRSLKRMGKISEAKAEFKLATAADGNLADAFYELGVVHESDKEYAEAVTAFQSYLQLKPDAAQRKTIEDRILYDKGQQ